MHELSIALRIVEVLEEELAGQLDGMLVTAINLQVGTLTGIVPEALQFSWEVASDESVLRGSELVVQVVYPKGHCSRCQADQLITAWPSLQCPTCGTALNGMTGGHELDIVTVDLDPSS